MFFFYMEIVFVLHFIPLFKNNTFVEKMYFIFQITYLLKKLKFLNDLSKKYQKFNYVLQINSKRDFKNSKLSLKKINICQI